MNKKLLTLAVAAALAAPAIASAEAIMYGKINVSLDYIDVDQNATFFRPGNSRSPSFNLGTFNSGTGGYNATTVNAALGSFTVVPAPQNGALTEANLGSAANAMAAYNQASAAAFAAGKTAIQANEAGTIAAAKAMVPYMPGATPAEQKTYLANLSKAQQAAFNTAGPLAGATTIQGYIKSQTNQLNANVASGQITRTAANAQINRLQYLQNVALGAAATGTAFTRGQQFKGWGMDQGWQGPADRLGVKGSEDLGNGLKAVYQIELGVDITNSSRDADIVNGNRGTSTTNSGFAFRNTYIGLAGDWGTALMGRHDTPLKISTGKLDLFSDTLADYNNTIGFQDLRVDNTVAYVSPSLSGFQFMAAIVPQGGAVALPGSWGGSFNPDEDTLAGIYSLAAIYKNGPFYGSIAYEALDKENWAAQNNNYALLYDGNTAEDDTKWRVGLGLLDWNGFSLTGIYEERQHILGAPEDADGNFFQIQAGYAFGNNTVKAMWGRADLNRCADPNGVGFRYTCPSSALGAYFAETTLVQNNEKTSWAIGYDYNFSKRTLAYALFTQVDDTNEDANWSGFSLGMMHSF